MLKNLALSVCMSAMVLGTTSMLIAQEEPDSGDTTLYAAAAAAAGTDGPKKEVTFGAGGRKFAPDSLSVALGTTVVFKPGGGASFEKYPLVSDEGLFADQTDGKKPFEFKFVTPGNFAFHCSKYDQKDNKGAYKMHCYIKVTSGGN